MLAQCIFLCMFLAIEAEMAGFIVGGNLAEIAKHPHSAHLMIRCDYTSGERVVWRCGSSILNQRMLLTAAHCVCRCNETTRLTASLGHENRESGIMRTGSGYVVHSKYDDKSFFADIAIVKISKPVKFSPRVSRVAIMRMPPYREKASIAGWGQIDTNEKVPTALLKELSKKVKKHAECKQMFKVQMPPGTICAETKKKDEVVAVEDSGSGLLVRGYIQIGIASFKVPSVAENIFIYTDVGFYYDWVTYNAEELYCGMD